VNLHTWQVIHLQKERGGFAGRTGKMPVARKMTGAQTDACAPGFG
jgi:hypothetical protein